jgi:MFS family permease
MAFFFVNLHTEKKTIMQKLGMVDWAGGFVFITSLTATLVAISSGGVDHPWSSWRVLVPLLIGIIGTILSLAYERYTATNPFLQRNLFPNLSAIATHMSALFQGSILFTTLYYVSFYFSAAKLASPLNAGAKLLAVAALVLPGSIVVSALITRLGTYRWAIWIGWTVTTLGCGLLILLDEHTSSAVYSTALSVLGLGLGMILSSVNFATQASVVDTADSGRAAGMYAFMRTLGMTLGVALGGTIFQNLMKQKLRDLGLPEAIAMNAEAYVQFLREMPVDDPTRVGVLKAYASGFRGVFVAETVIAVVALVGTGLVRHFSMDRILESKFRIEKGTEKTGVMEGEEARKSFRGGMSRAG